MEEAGFPGPRRAEKDYFGEVVVGAAEFVGGGRGGGDGGGCACGGGAAGTCHSGGLRVVVLPSLGHDEWISRAARVE